MDPASVTGVVIGAEGDEHQQQEDIKRNQNVPVLTHGLNINGRDNGKQDHTQHDTGTLNQDITDTVAEFIGIGGAEHTDHAETGGNQTQQKQNPVTLLGEIFKFGEELIQGTASFLTIYFIISWVKSK
jgi:hypothetical protein